MCSPIWVVGEYVEDVGVDIDFAALYNLHPHTRAEGLIKPTANGVEMRQDTCIYVTSKTKTTMFKTRVREAGKKNGMFELKFGQKYNLMHVPKNVDLPDESTGIHLPFLDSRWGGGGYNVCSALRSLCPDATTVPIRFTALGLYSAEAVSESIKEAANTTDLESDTNMKCVLKSIGPLKDCVEWSLAHNDIDFEFVRSDKILPRRNLVVQQIKSEEYQTSTNRIILKSPPSKMTGEFSEEELLSLVEKHLADSSMVFINSLSSEELFHALVKAISKQCQLTGKDDEPPYCILAMTEANQGHIDKLVGSYEAETKVEEAQTRPIAFFYLIFNEDELAQFLQKITIAPWNEDDAKELRDQLKANQLKPRSLRKALNTVLDLQGRKKPVFVTLGAAGALAAFGRDLFGAGPYGRSDKPVIDTTGAGDAWAAAICLQYHLHSQSEKVPIDLLAFMAFASAVASAKVTNRLGKITLSNIQDLTETVHVKILEQRGFLSEDRQKETWDLKSHESKEISHISESREAKNEAQWQKDLYARRLSVR